MSAASIQFVTIQFDFFETYNESDVVYLHDGNTIDSPLLSSFNGSLPTPPGPLTTTGRQMLIRFTTDASNSARGFSAVVRSLAAGRPEQLELIVIVWVCHTQTDEDHNDVANRVNMN